MAAGAVTLATSHHSGLKTFASVTAGAENARMVFDERTKTPVFRVETGMPGKATPSKSRPAAGLPGPNESPPPASTFPPRRE